MRRMLAAGGKNWWLIVGGKMDNQQTINRRKFMKRILYGGIGGAAAVSAGLYFITAKKKPHYNVLFIISDDLRPQLGCYGEPQMVTPNIDRLASRGMVFEHSYCQQALCAPSRASLLSGLRPDSTKVYNLHTCLSHVLPNHIVLPKYFKQNGYETIAIGKVFHRPKDNIDSWSKRPIRIGQVSVPAFEQEQQQKPREITTPATPAYGLRDGPVRMADVPDNAYKDGQYTDYAIQEIRRLNDKPFFLCIGYNKPHLPYTAPKKYWDMYDPAKIKLADNPFPPQNATIYTLFDFTELRDYEGIPKENGVPIPSDQARHLIHGYYACVSYFDAQVGRLLEELDRLKQRKKTIIILWGDNGLKLGEHGSWSKLSNFEIDTRVPLIVSVPGMKAAGKHTTALVESVDIYPTLCELCGMDLPEQPMEGISFAPLLDNPGHKWKKAVFSQCLRGPLDKPGQGVMGYTMRTERYRYIEWKRVKDGKVLERELYDHHIDPQENVNVSNDPSYANAIKELEQMMKRGWKGALP